MNIITKFFRQLKGKRELKHYEKVYSLKLNELETKIAEIKFVEETIKDQANQTLIENLSKQIELYKQIQKLIRAEYIAVRSAVKALYGLE